MSRSNFAGLLLGALLLVLMFFGLILVVNFSDESSDVSVDLGRVSIAERAISIVRVASVADLQAHIESMEGLASKRYLDSLKAYEPVSELSGTYYTVVRKYSSGDDVMLDLLLNNEKIITVVVGFTTDGLVDGVSSLGVRKEEFSRDE